MPSKWEDPEVVERFANRDPDHRLARMIEAADHPEDLRVLDLGCAGGRNTIYLARLGCDVRAVDASTAMVEETRQRLADILGYGEAWARVTVGRMDDLGAFASGSLDLVLGLGLYQNALDIEEWHRAVGETARVLRAGGQCLVAHFTPDIDLTGKGVHPIPGEPHTFRGLAEENDRCVLFYAPELDEAMALHGLLPAKPSETVVVPTEKGRRSTVNGLYEKR